MFACIHIPEFPVQASLLSEPPEIRLALKHSPIAVLDGPANLPRVFAANAHALRAGIQIGMTKLQAEVCAGIALRKRSPAEEESSQAALLDCAVQFSPRVESTCPGSVILDLSGTEKLLGPGPRVVRDIAAKANAAGLDVRIAIASNPDTAFFAARGFSANSIIPAGEESSRLAPLPISVLPVSPEMLETLASWGIRTFQSLATLPSVAVVERLGQEGLHLRKLALGATSRTLLTAEPGADFTASFEFDDPVETLESIFFILNRLLLQLCCRLLATAQAASELRLTVGLNVRQINHRERAALQGRVRRTESMTASAPAGITLRVLPADCDHHSEHIWKLPVPTQDKSLLFNLIRLHLESTTLSAPIRELHLEIIPVKPRLAQGNLFLPPAPEPEKLELTLERIRGVVGSTDGDAIPCVGSPSLVDTHKPGSFTLRNFSSLQEERLQPVRNSPDNIQSTPCHPERSRTVREATRPAKWKDPYFSSEAGTTAPTPALRLFRPALETTVGLDGSKPHFVRLWNRHRRVLAASGPWSTSGNWWNASVWTREEWDVALQTPAGLGFYRIYRDRLRRCWFVEGVFD